MKRMDEKLQNQISGTNESDEDDNEDKENNGGIITDTKFTFDQVYHEYSKYVMKNHKYLYDKAVVRKVKILVCFLSKFEKCLDISSFD